MLAGRWGRVPEPLHAGHKTTSGEGDALLTIAGILKYTIRIGSTNDVVQGFPELVCRRNGVCTETSCIILASGRDEEQKTDKNSLLEKHRGDSVVRGTAACKALLRRVHPRSRWRPGMCFHKESERVGPGPLDQ